MLLPVLPTFTFNFQSYVVEFAVIFCNTAYSFEYSISFEIACNRKKYLKIGKDFCAAGTHQKRLFRKPKSNGFGHLVHFLTIFYLPISGSDGSYGWSSDNTLFDPFT